MILIILVLKVAHNIDNVRTRTPTYMYYKQTHTYKAIFIFSFPTLLLRRLRRHTRTRKTGTI